MSVYKEAFVELKRDAFEAAKRLGEDFTAAIVAAAEAAQPQAPQISLPPLVPPRENDILPRLVELHLRYHPRAWSLIDISRRSDRDQTIIRVRLPCRHVGWFELNETYLALRHDTHAVFYDFITGVLDGRPFRKCCCVPHEPPPPCTAGVCK